MPTEEAVAAAQEGAPEPEQPLSEYRAEREGKVAPKGDAAPDAGKTSAEPAAAPETQAGEKGSDKAPKPKKTFEERFDEIYGNWKRSERDVQDARERADKLEKELSELRQSMQKPATEERKANERPKEENYKTWEEYQEALVDWKLEQRLEKERQAAEEAAQKAEKTEEQEAQAAITRETFEAYNAGVKSVQEAHEDFREVLGNPDLKIPDYIQLSIINLEGEGPEVAYQLAKNAEVRKSILELNEKFVETGRPAFKAKAEREFWGFVRSLSSEKKPEPKPEAKPEPKAEAKPEPPPVAKPVSQAPEPIKPVGGTSGPAELDVEDIPLSEYRKGRETGRIR